MLDSERETHKFILASHNKQDDPVAMAKAKAFIAKFLSQKSRTKDVFVGGEKHDNDDDE